MRPGSIKTLNYMYYLGVHDNYVVVDLYVLLRCSW